jgi:hypothetical protein
VRLRHYGVSINAAAHVVGKGIARPQSGPMIGTIQARLFSGRENQPFGVGADVRRLKLLRFDLRFVN